MRKNCADTDVEKALNMRVYAIHKLGERIVQDVQFFLGSRPLLGKVGRSHHLSFVYLFPYIKCNTGKFIVSAQMNIIGKKSITTGSKCGGKLEGIHTFN